MTILLISFLSKSIALAIVIEFSFVTFIVGQVKSSTFKGVSKCKDSSAGRCGIEFKLFKIDLLIKMFFIFVKFLTKAQSVPVKSLS